MRDIVLVVLSAWLTSYLTAKFMKNNDDKKRETDITNHRQALIKALHAELVNFREIYDVIALLPDLPWNGSKVTVSHISQQYIAVYENQLNKIGILDKGDIPYIIRLYVNIKVLIDVRHQLNEICKEYNDYTRKMVADPSKSPLGKMLDTYKLALQYQDNVYELYPDVLKRLEKYEISKND